MNKVMAWSECTIKIGATPEGETMATELTEIKEPKYQSTTLESEDGDVLEAIKEGGQRVGYEKLPGALTLKTRIIEPDDELFKLLGLGEAETGGSATGEFNVKSHVVPKYFSVEVTPAHDGAKGIRAPKCSVSFQFGYSAQEGNYADLTFGILDGAAGYWYKRFTVKKS